MGGGGGGEGVVGGGGGAWRGSAGAPPPPPSPPTHSSARPSGTLRSPPSRRSGAEPTPSARSHSERARLASTGNVRRAKLQDLGRSYVGQYNNYIIFIGHCRGQPPKKANKNDAI